MRRRTGGTCCRNISAKTSRPRTSARRGQGGGGGNEKAGGARRGDRPSDSSRRQRGRRPAQRTDEAASRVSDRIVRVAAAVIVRGDGQVLLAQRPPGKAYAGYWEFP